jgi:hypothetical protein
VAVRHDDPDDDALAVRIEARPNGPYARPAGLATTVLTIEESWALAPAIAEHLVGAGLDLVRARSVDQAVRVLRATTPDAMMVVVGGHADENVPLRPGIDVLAQLPTDWTVPVVVIAEGPLSGPEHRVSRRVAAMVVALRSIRHAASRNGIVVHLLRGALGLLLAA